MIQWKGNETALKEVLSVTLAMTTYLISQALTKLFPYEYPKEACEATPTFLLVLTCSQIPIFTSATD